jgi:beta-lactamase superfamily II metal-dependent hydrolase
VLPITAATFGRVSFAALLPANLAAVWAFPLMMLGAALTAVAGVVSEPAGRLVGDVAFVPLWYLVQVARIGASLPYASLSVDGIGTLSAAVAYGVLGLLGLALLRRRQEPEEAPEAPAPVRLRLRPGIAAALVMLVAAGWLGWSQMAAAAPGRLTATVLDVGQGDSTLIQTPSGLRILVDGGPSGDRLLQALASQLPSSVHRIDLVVLSDGRDEHASGLVAVAERYDIGDVFTAPRPGTSASFRDLQAVLKERGVAVTEVSSGQWLGLGDGARLEVLAPDADGPKEAQALVLRLVHGNSSVLLSGAMDPAGARDLIGSGLDLRSTALIVPRHGGDAPPPDALMGVVAPRLAIISVGDNHFALPSPTTELALSAVPVLRTDQNGTIRLRFDAHGLGVDYERGAARQVTAASK